MRKLLLVPLLFLTACGSHTSVQRGYGSDRNQCQDWSEDMLPEFLNPNQSVDVKERNAKLVTLFSDCMYERGWTVATPTRASNSDFRADPGVGVGASIRPGRAFTEHEELESEFGGTGARQASPAAPQNQGAIVESPDLITNQGGPGVARKVPSQNPTITPPQ